MFMLTYTNSKGYPVKLVFDSKEEAEKWGAIYSAPRLIARRGGAKYTVEIFCSDAQKWCEVYR